MEPYKMDAVEIRFAGVIWRHAPLALGEVEVKER